MVGIVISNAIGFLVICYLHSETTAVERPIARRRAKIAVMLDRIFKIKDSRASSIDSIEDQCLRYDQSRSIGVLVDVPVMLSLVAFAKSHQHWFAPDAVADV